MLSAIFFIADVMVFVLVIGYANEIGYWIQDHIKYKYLRVVAYLAITALFIGSLYGATLF